MTIVTGEKQKALNQLFDELKVRYNGYRCVKCHRQPWPAWAAAAEWQQRCGCGPDFDGRGGMLEPVGNWMKEKLADMIERQTRPEDALARVQEANNAGLFPSKANPAQLQLMAKAAMAYDLDPMMQELIIYQGKPYITIDGRRRLDSRAGHHPSISFRALTAGEKTMYLEVDALDEKDVAVFCVLTTEHGSTVEGFGRVLASERKGSANLPVVSRSIEMAQKRAEVRARKMAYGPNPIPQGLEGIMGLDDEQIVEGEARVLENTPIAEPASAKEEEPQPQEPTGTAPESPPVATAEDPSQELEDSVAKANMTWDQFEINVLECDWAMWVSRKGTSNAALKRLEIYLKQQEQS